MTQRPGGEFAGAWESIAAASRGRRRTPKGEYPLYTTQELIKTLTTSNALDDATRAKIEAEVERRNAKKRK